MIPPNVYLAFSLIAATVAVAFSTYYAKMSHDTGDRVGTILGTFSAAIWMLWFAAVVTEVAA